MLMFACLFCTQTSYNATGLVTDTYYYFKVRVPISFKPISYCILKRGLVRLHRGFASQVEAINAAGIGALSSTSTLMLTGKTCESQRPAFRRLCIAASVASVHGLLTGLCRLRAFAHRRGSFLRCFILSDRTDPDPIIAVPTTVSVTATSLTLQWTPPADTGGSSINTWGIYSSVNGASASLLLCSVASLGTLVALRSCRS